MKILRILDDAIARFEKGLLVSMLAVIVGVNLMQIGIRLLQDLFRLLEVSWVLNAASWPADLNRLLVLWIAMVGGSLATRRHEHIKVDFVSRFLHGTPRRIVQSAICVVGVVVCSMMVVFAFQFLKMEYELGETLVALPVPLWVIQIIIPVGFAVIGFRFLLNLLEGGKPPEPEPGASVAEGEPLPSDAKGGAG